MTTLGADYIARHLYSNDRIHTPLPSPEAITDADMQFFRQQGFLAIENVFTTAEVEAAKAGLSWLIGGNVSAFTDIQFEDGIDVGRMQSDERESYVRKIMRFVEHEPRLKAMSEHPRLKAIVERLIGSEVKLIQDMALLKPPQVGREKPWHQDLAYFAIQPSGLVIGTWTALDRATLENGCMHVIPGSHRQGPRPHYHDRDCQLNDEDVQADKDVAVPLSPGGVLFFSALLHHGTPPNRSADRRRAVQLHYAATHCRSITEEEHVQLFADAKGYAGCVHFPSGTRPRPVVGKPGQI